jgi:hypothetical protein
MELPTVVFSGNQQEPSPPLVRQGEMRESGEGAEVLCAEEAVDMSYPRFFCYRENHLS